MEWNKLTVKEIKNQVDRCLPEAYPALLARLEGDDRRGVRNLADRLVQGIKKQEKETLRLLQLKSIEKEYSKKGYRRIVGMDEVGRGPLAGPVVSCALILPEDSMLFGIDDSKQVSSSLRESLYDLLLKEAVAVGIGVVDNREIDEINILQATKKSMHLALKSLNTNPDLILVDAVELQNLSVPQKAIIKGDARCYSIAAASIVAKVYRDRLMAVYHQEYPHYQFRSNKGYGSKEHVDAIREHGLSPIHRRSFCGNFL